MKDFYEKVKSIFSWNEELRMLTDDELIDLMEDIANNEYVDIETHNEINDLKDYWQENYDEAESNYQHLSIALEKIKEAVNDYDRSKEANGLINEINKIIKERFWVIKNSQKLMK